MHDIDPRDATIAELRSENAALRVQHSALQSQHSALQAEYIELKSLLHDALNRIAELEDRLGTNSRNSSMPPSSDLTRPPSKRRKTGKQGKRGAQKGHKKHSRELLPIEQVDAVKRLMPEQCDTCGSTELAPEGSAPLRHQVVEIPPVIAHVTEYQRCEAGCLRCGSITRARLPTGVPRGGFGPRLMALVALCTAKYRISKRGVQDLLSDFFGVTISLGMVPKIESKVSAWIRDAVEEARVFVRNEHVVHMDESGWREKNAKAWLWVAVASLVTVFTVASSRSSKVSKDMLGEGFVGFLVSDRWSAYSWVDPIMRQLCWAHLLRDFQKFVDRGGESKRIGEALLGQAKLMFDWWHRVRDGTISRATFTRRMKAVEVEVGRLVREAAKCEHDKTAGTGRDILRFELSLWTFVHYEGIEPTNNGGERAIRKAVIWRKMSFGTQSSGGSRYVERILTVIETLRQQQRNALDYLTEAGNAALRCEETPSILPNPNRE